MRFRTSRAWQSIGFVLFIVLLIVAAIAGGSFLMTLLLVALIVIGIAFGSLRVLVGSLVIAIILKNYTGLIKSFVDVFLPRTLDQFFVLVERTSGFDFAVTVFFFFYLLSFATSCVRPSFFTINNRTENKTKVAKKNEDENSS
jgi:sugar phosphate permease